MARSYTVSTLYSNSDYTLLLAMDWSYRDPAEPVSRSGKHTLSTEAQVSPVGLTQEQLVQILEEDLPNTSEQFDAGIDADLERIAAEDDVQTDPAPSEGEDEGDSGAFFAPPVTLPSKGE